jgi:hypothetical protein
MCRQILVTISKNFHFLNSSYISKVPFITIKRPQQSPKEQIHFDRVSDINLNFLNHRIPNTEPLIY